MNEIKLLPCPFCGGEAELLKGLCELDNYVMCLKCRCKTKLYNTKEAAIKAWNTRKPMERILERLEEGQEECYKLFAIGFNAEDRGGYDAYSDAIEIVKEEGGIE